MAFSKEAIYNNYETLESDSSVRFPIGHLSPWTFSIFHNNVIEWKWEVRHVIWKWSCKRGTIAVESWSLSLSKLSTRRECVTISLSSFGANIMLGLFESGAQNTKDHKDHVRLILLILQNFGAIRCVPNVNLQDNWQKQWGDIIVLRDGARIDGSGKLRGIVITFWSKIIFSSRLGNQVGSNIWSSEIGNV